MTYLDKNQNNANAVDLEIVELNSYYPYGMVMEYENHLVSSYANSTARKFKYNGIEHEEALGLDLYEMDVRHYDAAIARWTGIDPVTHHTMSTYMAFDGNPIYWADPSGADAEQDFITALYNSPYENGQTFGETFMSGGGNWTEVVSDGSSNLEGPSNWVSKDGGDTYYWDETITNEEEAKKAGLKFGGKTVSEVVKKEDSFWILNWFETLPIFDMKSFYESRVKLSIYEGIKRYVAIKKKNMERLEYIRVNGTLKEYNKFNDDDYKSHFDTPLNLAYINQFAPGKNYAEFNTTLELGDQSWEVKIQVRKVNAEQRSSNTLFFMKTTPYGNNGFLKGNNENSYQFRFGPSKEEPVISVIFGLKNKAGWKAFLNH